MILKRNTQGLFAVYPTRIETSLVGDKELIRQNGTSFFWKGFDRTSVFFGQTGVYVKKGTE